MPLTKVSRHDASESVSTASAALPTPIQVWDSYLDEVRAPALWRHTWTTLYDTIVGFAWATAIGLGGPINYISEEEAVARANAPFDLGRAWDLWKKQSLGK